MCCLAANMRKEKITTGEYYHIYNRAVDKQAIFHDRFDYSRFLFLILYFQSEILFKNIFRYIISYIKSGVFSVPAKHTNEIIKLRSLELTLFCIMPNHFHIVVKQLKEEGVALYMHRVLGGYSKFFNHKYKRKGHLFEATYKVVHIENNIQLLYLSTYIHRNPRSISKWLGKESLYEWSSYQDCIDKNRFENLLNYSVIVGQFPTKKKYYQYVESSTAKK